MQMIDSMLIVLQLERKKSTVKAEAQMWCDISVMSCVWSLAQCLWSEGQEVITKDGTTPRFLLNGKQTIFWKWTNFRKLEFAKLPFLILEVYLHSNIPTDSRSDLEIWSDISKDWILLQDHCSTC